MKELKHSLNNFDFIRFIIAILVVVAHSVSLTGNGISYVAKYTKYQVNLGSICVDIFFIISGYLICASYIRINNIFKYALSRILRIMPALIAVILITAFLIGPIVSSVPKYFTNPLTYSYLKGIFLYPIQYQLTGFNTHAPTQYNNAVNGSLWTLPVEFTCYFFVAMLGYCKLLNKYTSFLISIVSLFFFVNFVPIFHPKENVYYPIILWNLSKFCYLSLIELFRLMSYFFAGSFVFFIKNKIVYSWKWCLLSLIIILLSCQAGYNLDIITPIFGTYLVFYFAFNNKIKLQNFGKYGDFSYGIYIYGFLTQQIVVMLFHGKMSNTLNYIISIPIVIILGFLSYHLIEKKFMKLKKYI